MSSSIKAAIAALKEKIAAAYAKVSDKGGTLPTDQTAANLADAIDSIPSCGDYVNYETKTEVVATSDGEFILELVKDFISNTNNIYYIAVEGNSATQYYSNNIVYIRGEYYWYRYTSPEQTPTPQRNGSTTYYSLRYTANTKIYIYKLNA